MTLLIENLLVLRSRPLQRQRDALPDADAHRRQRAPDAAIVHFERRGQRQARAGHAQGMADRDGAAVRVHVLGVVGQGIALALERA